MPRYKPFKVDYAPSVAASTATFDTASVVLSHNFRERKGRQQTAPQTALGLPHELTCSRCDKPKNQRGFSQRQKELYTRFRGEIFCLDCNGEQKQEMECSSCLRTRPLKHFARSQRSRKEEAECNDCVRERVQPMTITDQDAGGNWGDADGTWAGTEKDSLAGTEHAGTEYAASYSNWSTAGDTTHINAGWSTVASGTPAGRKGRNGRQGAGPTTTTTSASKWAKPPKIAAVVPANSDRGWADEQEGHDDFSDAESVVSIMSSGSEASVVSL